MIAARRPAAVATMAVGLAVLVARPLLPGGRPVLLALFVTLLVVGAAWPLVAEAEPGSGGSRRRPAGDISASPSVSASPHHAYTGTRGRRKTGGHRLPPNDTHDAPDAPAGARAAAFTPVLVLVAGIAAFGAGRLLGGHHPPGPRTAAYIGAITLAAVAEELFFRRFVYAVLRRGGVAMAVGGSTVLFALAHVTVYGWWVLPLDLAAGLILGWQRWASGTWAVPAVTHMAANLFVVL